MQGATVRASVIKLTPGAGEAQQGLSTVVYTPQSLISTSVIRGGLPVYRARAEEFIGQDAVPYIHTTDLQNLSPLKMNELPLKTSIVKKGRISGNFILLPRVGVPDFALVKALRLSNVVQLSDCVIGLKFSSKEKAVKAADRIILQWQSLLGLYRGTGARYITLSRLQCWLEGHGFEIA